MRSVSTQSEGRRSQWTLVGTTTVKAAALALVLAVPATTSAVAQGLACAARDIVLGHLAARYGEHPISLGVTATGSLLEVLASPDGSWTIIVTQPGGPTCLVISGDGWRDAPARHVEKPEV